MYLLGIDLGSSSVKVSILEAKTGKCLITVQSPDTEMKIIAKEEGWAEQIPIIWWSNLTVAVNAAIEHTQIDAKQIQSIGISYQMHGLICVDKGGKVLRPAIIWCDSRAVEIGKQAFEELGEETCFTHLRNSLANFTASKLKWVKDNEPEIYEQIYKIMLPGDYISYRLTGNLTTTISGLSEAMLWDYKNEKLADILLDHYGIDKNLIPEIVPTFANHGTLTKHAAAALGLTEDTVVSYRAGDQANNAFSLKVLNAGEIAATAGTSGVVYGISNNNQYDKKSRVNTFVHVNNAHNHHSNGVLLCINGTGILNSWLQKNIATDLSYAQMNELAQSVPAGSEGLMILPFGNGAERIFENQDLGCSILNLNFNRHTKAHLLRAAQEGIVFSFYYGMKIMQEMGIEMKVIRAGLDNMFLSELFVQTLANLSGAKIQLYNTNGAIGAARGAGIGIGIYESFDEAFSNLECVREVKPDTTQYEFYQQLYKNWETYLKTS